MKKVIAVLTVLMCFASMNVFAQLKEVRGVQTRVVVVGKYEYSGYERDEYGYEFKNENAYPVWVEAELLTRGVKGDRWDSGYVIPQGTCDTKYFTLDAGETYVWKCGDRMKTYGEDKHEYFFVRYKAYKTE